MLDGSGWHPYRTSMKSSSFLLSFCIPFLVVFSAKRPNVLFAFADDWGRQASFYAKIEGAGGINDVAKTPHFDKLAKRGVLFTNASVNAPSCTPCRSAILSGRNFWETGRGAILQGAVWDEKIPTWPLLLKDSGTISVTPTRSGLPALLGMQELEDRPMPLPRREENSTAFRNMFPAGSPEGLP